MTQLVGLLLPVIAEPWCVIAGGGLCFDDRNYREPDLQVVRRAALPHKLASPGDALLVVAVMSPSTVSTDRVSNPAQYAAAGIPHFWRVEPVARVLVTHGLDGVVYRESGRYTDEVVVEEPGSAALPVGSAAGLTGVCLVAVPNPVAVHGTSAPDETAEVAPSS